MFFFLLFYFREMKVEGDKLKMRIVRSKYFKSEEPNFLTWSEKEQIRSLHEKDQVEWTPARLSESFPALPETIQKILRSKFKPDNVEIIHKYDANVVENWKKFKTGQFALNPLLVEHLNKFKGRKINLEDMKSMAEKFVKEKPVFPEPRTKLFMSIVKNSIEKKPDNVRVQISDEKSGENSEKTPKKKEENYEKIQEKYRLNYSVSISDKSVIKIDNKPNNLSNNHMTFDKFVEKTVESIENKGEEELSLENKLLIDEYKKKKNQQELERVVFNEKPVIQSEEKLELKTPAEVVETDNRVNFVSIDETAPTTGIIEWNKKKSACGDDDYPRFIKVPKAKAKQGVTFKVNDRYYDYDGEFLYRVPGLKS